jgi:hypothetical protein
MGNIGQLTARYRFFGRILRPVRRGLVLIIFIALGSLLMIRPVHADPHAVFYTAVGQQQLFFNVLAALDQADYVETEAQRLQLVDQRQAAAPGAVLVNPDGSVVEVPPFSPESYPGITATEAEGFSAILTRLLTLEGNDLYTDFLTRTFALEASRRNSLEEVANIYCQEALGWPNCREPNSNDPTARADVERAYVADPKRRGQEAYLRGATGVLGSGEEYDQEKRVAIMADAVGPRENLELPYEFDPHVDEWTQYSKTFPLTGWAVDRIKNVAELSRVEPVVDPGVFSDIVFDASGDAHLAQDPRINDVHPIDFFTGKLGNLLALPIVLNDAAEAGEQRYLASQSIREAEGSRADVELRADIQQSDIAGPDPELGAIEAYLRAPAGVKRASYEAAIHSLPNAEATLQHAVPTSKDIPGQVELVRRGPGIPPTPNPSPPLQTPILVTTPLPGAAAPPASAVAGIQSRPGQGQVAGILVNYQGDLTHDPKTPYSAAVNSAGVHHEQGYQHLLSALSMRNQGDGCGCSVSGVLGNFGSNVLDLVNGG